MSNEPRLDRSCDRIIVIDNIPVVGQEKKDKLRQILTKLLTKYGTIVNEYYPESENGNLKGYCDKTESIFELMNFIFVIIFIKILAS